MVGYMTSAFGFTPGQPPAWDIERFMHGQADVCCARLAVDVLNDEGGVLDGRPLELEVRDGHAWVGITPFVIRACRFRGLPVVPILSGFPELNLRTYVRAAGKPGIWFFSLDAGSRAAVSQVDGGRWLTLEGPAVVTDDPARVAEAEQRGSPQTSVVDDGADQPPELIARVGVITARRQRGRRLHAIAQPRAAGGYDREPHGERVGMPGELRGEVSPGARRHLHRARDTGGTRFQHRDLDLQLAPTGHLAGEPRAFLVGERALEHVELVLAGRIEALATLAHDEAAGAARQRAIAVVRDVDAMRKHGVEQRPFRGQGQCEALRVHVSQTPGSRASFSARARSCRLPERRPLDIEDANPQPPAIGHRRLDDGARRPAQQGQANGGQDRDPSLGGVRVHGIDERDRAAAAARRLLLVGHARVHRRAVAGQRLVGNEARLRKQVGKRLGGGGFERVVAAPVAEHERERLGVGCRNQKFMGDGHHRLHCETGMNRARASARVMRDEGSRQPDY